MADKRHFLVNNLLIDKLIKDAKEFIRDKEWYARNRHMLFLRGIYVGSETQITEEVTAAVLTGFLNHVAANLKIDLGLYLYDLVGERDND